jgi:hypothetical protein
MSSTNTGSVYIGRPSIFGNPIPVGYQGKTRAQVLEMYEAYARERIAKDDKFREAVEGLYGKVLSCWCKPLACHGDVLAILAAELNNGR